MLVSAPLVIVDVQGVQAAAGLADEVRLGSRCA